jgi:predicted proteasome-type protease
MSTQHLKLHPLTGTSDHDLTGLVQGQLLYNSGGTSGVQSSGLYTNGSGGLSATTLSGGTILSGSTNLYNIFLTAGQLSGTSVSAGSNIIVAVNGSDYRVSVSGNPQFNSVTASGASSFTTLSATTLISGSTNLYQIFAPFGTVSGVEAVGAVGNLFTGGTAVNPTINITASPSFNSITASGSSNFSAGLSASTLSGGTILSGSTNLYQIFAPFGSSGVASVGTTGNLFTGGTALNPTINITASPSFASVTASGSSNFSAGLSASTLSGGTILSGSTNLYSIFAPFGSGVQSVGANGNLSTGGTATNPTIILVASPSFNSVTASGSSNFSAGLSASTLSGGTILSGSTNIGGLFVNGVTAGSNTAIGGSSTFPSVSVVASPSFNSVTASGASSFATLSATTYISGSTNLYQIFAPFGSSGVASVGQGSNITTGGTALNPTINLSSSIGVNNLVATGNTSLNTLTASGTSNFTGALQSGGTDLANIFVQGSGTNGTIPLWNGTRVQGNSVITQSGTGVTVNGSIYIYGNVDVLGTATTFNTTTVSTSDNNITMNLSGSHVSAFGGGITVLSGTPSGVASTWTIDANGAWSSNTQILTSAITVNGGAIASTGGGTITSGGTNLYSIFAAFGSGVQSVGANGNLSTGGTATNPTIILASSPSFASITASGSSNFSAGLSASTLSGGTILSGSTNLYAIFAPFGSSGVASVGQGSNITTGGTVLNPTISVVASPSFNSVTASGSSNFSAGLSASTLSGGTILSGSTNIGGLFVNGVTAGSNTTIGGSSTFPSVSVVASPSFNSVTASGSSNFSAGLSASTLSGGTILSGSTNLYSIFTTGAHTAVQPGTNITTGGTAANPTINVVSSPSFASVTASGSSNFSAGLSASTLSGGTILSGSTNLYSIFTTGAHTAVQPGSNITTGGTAANPTVSLVASPSVSNFTASGNTSLQGTTGTTIYASQFFAITPYTGANPTSPVDDQMWMYSAATGIITLNYRVGGVTKGVELS